MKNHENSFFVCACSIISFLFPLLFVVMHVRLEPVFQYFVHV
uniref:Uncharacterized protein n=1 Tax=Arundo donax TaxID=35708 RepID=A0A0A9HPZ9_ARUDO